MSQFTVKDFDASLAIADIDPNTIVTVLAAWGEEGDDKEWAGGFLLQVKGNEEWLYLSGWCDTSGWGCQEGVVIRAFSTQPTFLELEKNIKPWIESPPDLNNWLKQLIVGKDMRDA